MQKVKVIQLQGEVKTYNGSTRSDLPERIEQAFDDFTRRPDVKEIKQILPSLDANSVVSGGKALFVVVYETVGKVSESVQESADPEPRRLGRPKKQ